MWNFIRAPWKTKVFAGIASIPSRAESLRCVVDAIGGQIDHLYVYLNGYASAPAFLRSRHITVYSSDCHGDLHDRGKFFALNEVKTGAFLAIDDDIIYPDDYAERMLATLQEPVRKELESLESFVILSPAPRIEGGVGCGRLSIGSATSGRTCGIPAT